MKIKTKKQLNLPQLIEWAMDNDIRDECFLTHDSEGNISEVSFDIRGLPKFSSVVDKSDTFTVTIKEEITEDTKLDLLLDHFINPYGHHYVGNIYRKRSINDVLEENDEMEMPTNSIHLFDIETNEFKLIWRDGKLVE